MSHAVTIRTQTVTTTSSSTYYVNTGYLKTWSGICKLVQLALGIICVGISGALLDNNYIHRYSYKYQIFFLLMATTFMIGTFIILVSCLASLSTASIMSKTVYEFIYHAVAFGLLLAASLAVVTNINRYTRYDTREYELSLTASICGFVNSGLYLFSAILAHRGRSM